MSDEILNNDQPADGQDEQLPDEQVQDQVEEQQEPETPDETSSEEKEKPKEEQDDPFERGRREAQEKAAKAIVAQRKAFAQKAEEAEREKEQLRQQLARYQQPQHSQSQNDLQIDPSRMVYHKATNRYYNMDSTNPLELAVVAQILIEEESKVKNKELESKQLMENMVDKVIAGSVKYGESYDEALATFRAMGNDDIASALVTADDPAQIVHYLGSNPHEIERLLQVPNYAVGKEIYKLENALKGSKKTVSQAKPPGRDFGQPVNKFKSIDQQSFEERERFYKQRYNSE